MLERPHVRFPGTVDWGDAGGRAAARRPPQHGIITLRAPRPGEYGWLVQRQAKLFAASTTGINRSKGSLARVIADFTQHHDPLRETCWVAEQDGTIVGSACCGVSTTVARIRLLLIEPDMRGWASARNWSKSACDLRGGRDIRSSRCRLRSTLVTRDGSASAPVLSRRRHARTPFREGPDGRKVGALDPILIG